MYVCKSMRTSKFEKLYKEDIFEVCSRRGYIILYYMYVCKSDFTNLRNFIERIYYIICWEIEKLYREDILYYMLGNQVGERIWNLHKFEVCLRYPILYIILTQVGFVLNLLLEPICIL